MDGFGANPEERFRRAGAREERHAPPGERCGRLRLLNLSDCAAAPRRGYIVKGLFAPGDLIILFGPPGSGKSALLRVLSQAGGDRALQAAASQYETAITYSTQ